MSSEMLHNARWYTVTDVSKDSAGFFLRVKQSVTTGVTCYCLIVKMRVLGAFGRSVSVPIATE